MTADAPIRFELRPYQHDAIEATVKAEARGVRAQLGVAATGLGKTVIFCSLAAQRGGRTLILAHRDELVSQAVQKVHEIWPGVDVGIIKAEANDVHAQVIVASVQTLSRQKRLAQLVAASDSVLMPTAPLDLVIVDEAHHSAAVTYKAIINGLRAGHGEVCVCGHDRDGHVEVDLGRSRCTCQVEGEEGVAEPCPCDAPEYVPPGPLLLGVTATPDRGDGVGLDDVFGEIVWNYDILWGIRSGFLADVRAKRITLDQLDLSKVKVSRGDYDAGSAGRAMEDASAPEYVVKAWLEHAKDRQTLVFTPTVDLAQSVADQFAHAGVKAAMVSGETPLMERRAILRDYAAGEIQVVANCAVLTEGFDEPRTDCIVVARPTKSRALFTQMIGRGTRRHPAKDHLLVLDVVDASTRLSLITVPSLFGLPEQEAAEVQVKNLTDVVDEFEARKVAAGLMRAQDADLFHKMRGQGIAWIHVPGTTARYERPLPQNMGTLVLVEVDPSTENSWRCGVRFESGEKQVFLWAGSMELAQGVAEDYARKRLGSKMAFIATDARWRKNPPSEKALAFAKKLRVPHYSDYATAGELADAIDTQKNRKART